MKKKFVAIIGMALMLCLSVIVLAGCSGGSNSSNSSSNNNAQPETQARTTLVVGFDQDFPPYGYIGDDGQYTGFDLDLAAEVGKRTGWEVTYLPINWDAKDLELASGSIDCIWNGFTIEGREDNYTFTEPYMDNSQVVVVRSDSGITSLEGLAGKTVAAQIDSAAFHLLDITGDQAALAATFGNFLTIAEYNSAFMELEAGSVDAVAMDLPVARFQLAGQEDKFTILENEPLSEEHYGVGFLMGNTELRDEVENVLKEMVADGTVKTICDKYTDQGISYEMWVLKA